MGLQPLEALLDRIVGEAHLPAHPFLKIRPDGRLTAGATPSQTIKYRRAWASPATPRCDPRCGTHGPAFVPPSGRRTPDPAAPRARRRCALATRRGSSERCSGTAPGRRGRAGRRAPAVGAVAPPARPRRSPPRRRVPRGARAAYRAGYATLVGLVEDAHRLRSASRRSRGPGAHLLGPHARARAAHPRPTVARDFAPSASRREVSPRRRRRCSTTGSPGAHRIFGALPASQMGLSSRRPSAR